MIPMDLQLFGEKNIQKQSSPSLKKGIRSYREVIRLHEKKIADPVTFYPEWDTFDQRYQAGCIKHWKKEIMIAQQSIDDRIKELRERGDDDEG